MRRGGGWRGGEWEEKVVGEGENEYKRIGEITWLNAFLFPKNINEYLSRIFISI